MLDYPAATRLQRQLADLPDLLVLARLALEPGTGARGARVSGATRTAPLPLNLDALNWLGPSAPGHVHDPSGDQDPTVPLAYTLGSWARLIAGETEQCLVTRTIGGHLAFLARRPVLAWSVLQPWADEYADEIGDVHRHALRLSRTRPRRWHLPQIACPRCDLLSLVREDGRDIECSTPGCGVILRPDELSHRAEQILAELHAA